MPELLTFVVRGRAASAGDRLYRKFLASHPHKSQPKPRPRTIPIRADERAESVPIYRPETLTIVLPDANPAIMRRIGMALIKALVCEHYDISHIDLISARRPQYITRPRMVAAYLGRKYTTLSLPQIGKALGNRDHTTILHACRAITERILTDDKLDAEVAELEAKLLEASQ